MAAKLCTMLCLALVWCVPGNAALVVSLDQPFRSAAPGELVEFSGTIANTGPESASVGIDERFNPAASPPFSIALPLALAGFAPGPGESYTGPLFAVFLAPSAAPGDSLLTLAQITAALPTGVTLTSNGVLVEVDVVPEPGGAVLLGVPALALAFARRYPRFLPVTR